MVSTPSPCCQNSQANAQRLTSFLAYNKDAPPPAISGFSGPQELGGSINAPSGYLGYQFFPFSQSQGYDPATCASACTQQTNYNSQHPGSDGSFQTCVSHLTPTSDDFDYYYRF